MPIMYHTTLHPCLYSGFTMETDSQGKYTCSVNDYKYSLIDGQFEIPSFQISLVIF